MRRKADIADGRKSWGGAVDDDWMSAEAFEALVISELDLLPDEMIDGIENVAFEVEDEPDDATRRRFGIYGDRLLLGLYTGVALTRRGNYGRGELPDRIILFRRALLAKCHDEATLRRQVHVTLVHEIGHYYGEDDAALHELGWD